MGSLAADDPPVEVREAREDEYDAAGAVTVAAYRADGFVTDDDAYSRELRDAAARAAHGCLLVAVSEGDVVGTASVFSADAGPRWAEQAEPGDAVLRMLAVAPEARMRGLGEALTVASIEVARSMGCRRLLLSTRPTMHAAHRIYARLGFRRTPEHDWQPIPGFWLWGFQLDL